VHRVFLDRVTVMMTKREHHFLRIVRKIHVFQGLVLGEASRLLSVCRSVTYKRGARVYEAGAPSTDMIILLTGRLVATSESGRLLGEISPGSATGEMGLFTGQPRSATIEATEQSMALLLRRPDLEKLMRSDHELCLKLTRNIIGMLAHRLSQANARIEQRPAPRAVRGDRVAGSAPQQRRQAAAVPA
jgi:CRP-like cAMP-binding protein